MTAARLLPAALVAVLLAGCGGGDEPRRAAPAAAAGPAPTPAGFARYSGPGFSFAHPEGYARAGRSERGEQVVELTGEPGTGGYPPQVAVAAGPARNSLADAVRLHKDFKRIRAPGYRVLAEKRVELPGAAGAHRIEAEQEFQREGDEAVRVRTIDLLVQTRDGRQLTFFARAPAGDFDAARLREAMDSVRLG